MAEVGGGVPAPPTKLLVVTVCVGPGSYAVNLDGEDFNAGELQGFFADGLLVLAAAKLTLQVNAVAFLVGGGILGELVEDDDVVPFGPALAVASVIGPSRAVAMLKVTG
jgi:hypothetical protein